MGADERTDVTGALIRRARGVTAGKLPDEVGEVARHCLLDWFGCALPGWTSRWPASFGSRPVPVGAGRRR